MEQKSYRFLKLFSSEALISGAASSKITFSVVRHQALTGPDDGADVSAARRLRPVTCNSASLRASEPRFALHTNKPG